MEPFQLFLLILLGLFLVWIGYLLGKALTRRVVAREERAIRDDAVKRSRAVLTGQISEQLAPFLPGFPWKPSEARFIGKPIDFLIFTGMDEKEISEVVFVEVKSGNAKLSPVERSVKEAIDERRVRWAEYRPEMKTTLK